MKKILLTALAFTAFCASAFAQDLKVMTVDMSTLYDQYYKAIEARETLQFDAQTAEDELNTMLEKTREIRDEAQSIQQAMTDENSPLSEEKRMESQKQLAALQEDFMAAQQEAMQFRQQQQEILQQRRQSIAQTQYNDIRQIVIEVAEKKGATLVLNSGNNMAVIYAIDAYDATEEVLEILNKDAPKD